MSPKSTGRLKAILNAVEARANDLRDPLDATWHEHLPARLRGLITTLHEKCGKIANHFTYKRGEARQKSISQGIDSTKLDSDLFALDRKEDVSRSRAEEEWYRGLS